MGAKPPHPMERTTVTGSSTVLPVHLMTNPPHQTERLNRDKGIQIEWKFSQCWCPVWMSKTRTQIELVDVGHNSVVPVWIAHDMPWQRSGQFAKNFKSNLTGYHCIIMSLKWSDIRHNWNCMLSSCYHELCMIKVELLHVWMFLPFSICMSIFSSFWT